MFRVSGMVIDMSFIDFCSIKVFRRSCFSTVGAITKVNQPIEFQHGSANGCLGRGSTQAKGKLSMVRWGIGISSSSF